nr:hypothetical protein [Staphylococcus pseudintermedius]
MAELNLYQKIADVKANVDNGFTKDAKGYNYDYVKVAKFYTKYVQRWKSTD